MVDLLDLLEQTKAHGIKVYTHGEMIPAHMYRNCANTRTLRAITAAPSSAWNSRHSAARFSLTTAC